MADRTNNGAPSARSAKSVGAEQTRLLEDTQRRANWKRWGPYLSERQWGTVREDYSPDGSCWTSFPHDQARSRAYRWGEDGLLGITDRQCRLCFAVALWNGRDPILKERLFGLTGPEGNHGEDVKEEYFYLDSTPTHSYMKALYKYPQTEFPYARLVEENAKRGRYEPEYELKDTGVFDESRYFDVEAEYAKAGPDDLLIRIKISNRGSERSVCHVLPTAWFRNTWSWGCTHEGCWIKPHMRLTGREGAPIAIECDHVSLGKYALYVDHDDAGKPPVEVLFTENQTNNRRVFDVENESRCVKDAFHERVIHGRAEAVNPAQTGTKAAAWFRLEIPAGGSVTLRLRLASQESGVKQPFGGEFERTFEERLREADEFFDYGRLADMSEEERRVIRQAYAGLFWSKQFYHYVVKDWLEGDPGQPTPPESRKSPGSRNVEWTHLFNRDVISMPDKWEYPWYAVWDLAFHCVAFAKVDEHFAKEQLLLMLREWYMHPSGAIPAYEFAFGDVNPPVHAWACWRVYKMTAARGGRDRQFLERCFHKLLLNFTWWVNRKDPEGRNLFGGGFLGLDNIGVFDRGKPLPGGWKLEQADGTAWMAFYCGTMLSIALELAQENPAYEDVASKFFEHFVAIVDAMNSLGGSGLWDEEDGFYYDHVRLDHRVHPLKVRSLVGAMPLIAVEVLEEDQIDRLPGFRKRMDWFLEHRKDLAQHVSYMCQDRSESHSHRLLAIPSRDRLERVLRRLLDEAEFLGPNGIRSVSRFHRDHPFVIRDKTTGNEYRVAYDPAESTTSMFGGNSNWRGPVWFPINFLIVEALERYHHFYGDDFTCEHPVGSGRRCTLAEVAADLRKRLIATFLPDGTGRRPCHGEDARFASDVHWKDLVLFYEYFHGDTGKGLGASHQTGWTALVAPMLRDKTRLRTERGVGASTAARK
ncbi:MAG: glucosidase [Phycisphaeraceae bacterium]|nr:glucosidase [Phycisphaeraceae bacterium]